MLNCWWFDSERTLLPPLFDEIHPNPRVSKAREKLQESTEQLDASLQDYARKFAEYPALETTVVPSNGVQSSSLPERDFSRFIEQVQSDHKISTETISGKVAACMSKVYPIATFALGIVSLGADVSCPFLFRTKLFCQCLTNIARFLPTFEDHCQRSYPSHFSGFKRTQSIWRHHLSARPSQHPPAFLWWSAWNWPPRSTSQHTRTFNIAPNVTKKLKPIK